MKMALCVLAAGLAAATAKAELPEGDVLLGVEGGRIITGRISEDGMETTPGVRVFFAELGEDVPGVSDEPGLRALTGTFSPAGTAGFDILARVRKWSGVDFSILPPETFTASYGPNSVETPTADFLTPGLEMPVEADGAFHEHPTWMLNSPMSDGVYLVQLSLHATSVGASDPVWILFGQNADEDAAESAYTFALANVPGPGALTFLVAGGLCSARRNRRS